MAALGIVGGEAVRVVAEEATARLERAIATLAGPVVAPAPLRQS